MLLIILAGLFLSCQVLGAHDKVWSKKIVNILWTRTHKQAFPRIKDAVCESTLLSYCDKTKPIFIEVDASGQGLGAVLLQGSISNEELKQASQTDGKYLKFRNKLKPIAFASKSLSEAQQRMPPSLVVQEQLDYCLKL